MNKGKESQTIAESYLNVSSSIGDISFLKTIIKFVKKIMKNCQELESVPLFNYWLQLQAVYTESLLPCYNFVQISPSSMHPN